MTQLIILKILDLLEYRLCGVWFGHKRDEDPAKQADHLLRLKAHLEAKSRRGLDQNEHVQPMIAIAPWRSPTRAIAKPLDDSYSGKKTGVDMVFWS